MEIVLWLLALLFSFTLIGVVTERHFIPSLENIARRLQLSESVAGASLLAFGSSAPELFTALLTMVALRSTPAFGVGSVVGSALFQILVVIGFAALVKTSYLRWRPVVRDGLAYAIAVAMLYLFVRDGIFTVGEGFGLVGAYLVYLAVLVLWSRLVPPAAKKPAVAEESVVLFALVRRLRFLARPAELLLRPLPDPRRHPA